MAKRKRSLPHEVLIRWNEDGKEPYLELSEKVDDICISAGESAPIGVYRLYRKATARAIIEVS